MWLSVKKVAEVRIFFYKVCCDGFAVSHGSIQPISLCQFLAQRFFGSKEFTDPYLQHFSVNILPVEKEMWSSVGIALGVSSPDQ